MTQATLPLITTSLLVTDLAVRNGEPRILDTLLAERLGMERLTNIRTKIKENFLEISMHGPICTETVQIPGARGRPGTAYYLNEPQALLLCMFANTPKAAQIRKSVIDVFMEYRRGKVGKLPTQVRAHERRTSTKVDKAITLARSIDRLERIADTLIPQPVIPSLCAMVVDNRPVFVDTTAYTDLDNDLVVAVRHDGSIGLEAATSRSGNNFFGPRSALGCPFKQGGATHRNGVVVIGKVMGANLPTGIGLTAGDIGYINTAWPAPTPQLEFKRKSHGPDIVRLIGDGKEDADIARSVGVTTQAVTYWRRKMAA
ncbi:hypothetical protein ACXIUS_29730 [Bosea thiooxidans]